MAVIQLGTLLAVLVYFARDIINITRAFIVDHLALFRGESRPDGKKLSNDVSFDGSCFWVLLVGLVGLLFKKQIEGHSKKLWVIATMMVVVVLCWR